MKIIFIALMILVLTAASSVNFAAENETEKMEESSEEANLTKHALEKGKIIGILMLALVVIIVTVKYTRGY